MSTRTRHFRLFALAAAATLVTLVGLTLLPHDPYIRWKAVRTEAFARLGWVYERIHFDDTPIDVAFIGTSHTMNGIDAAAIGDDLRKAGLATAAGRCVQTANLAVPAYGRNMHWLVTRELLRSRQVGTIVIEVLENESRKPHPIFYTVADVRDVLDAPMLINIDYALDVMRMPWRQLGLFFKTLWPNAFGLPNGFDPARYDGSNVDNTRQAQVDGTALTPFRDRQLPAGELDKIAAQRAGQKNLNILGKRFERFEYAIPDTYLGKMLALAKEKGIRVVFLYLPGYGLPPQPFDTFRYDGKGPMLSVNDLLRRKDFWFDNDHLNAAGAQAVTARVASELAPVLAADGHFRTLQGSAPQACQGYPERPIDRPFVPSHTAAAG